MRRTIAYFLQPKPVLAVVPIAIGFGIASLLLAQNATSLRPMRPEADLKFSLAMMIFGAGVMLSGSRSLPLIAYSIGGLAFGILSLPFAYRMWENSYSWWTPLPIWHDLVFIAGYMLTMTLVARVGPLAAMKVATWLNPTSDPTKCPHCGYLRYGLPSKICPECGTESPSDPPPSPFNQSDQELYS